MPGNLIYFPQLKLYRWLSGTSVPKKLTLFATVYNISQSTGGTVLHVVWYSNFRKSRRTHLFADLCFFADDYPYTVWYSRLPGTSTLARTISSYCVSSQQHHHQTSINWLLLALVYYYVQHCPAQYRYTDTCIPLPVPCRRITVVQYRCIWKAWRESTSITDFRHEKDAL